MKAFPTIDDKLERFLQEIAKVYPKCIGTGFVREWPEQVINSETETDSDNTDVDDFGINPN